MLNKLVPNLATWEKAFTVNVTDAAIWGLTWGNMKHIEKPKSVPRLIARETGPHAAAGCTLKQYVTLVWNPCTWIAHFLWGMYYSMKLVVPLLLSVPSFDSYFYIYWVQYCADTISFFVLVQTSRLREVHGLAASRLYTAMLFGYLVF